MPAPAVGYGAYIVGAAVVSVAAGYIWEKHTPMGDGTYTRNEAIADAVIGAAGLGYIKQVRRLGGTANTIRKVRRADDGLYYIKPSVTDRALFNATDESATRFGLDVLAIQYIRTGEARRNATDLAVIGSFIAVQHFAKSGPQPTVEGIIGGPIGRADPTMPPRNLQIATVGNQVTPGVTPQALGGSPKISRKKNKRPSKMSQEQKKRLWRMGLRWCRKHRRYDRCSLRARKA